MDCPNCGTELSPEGICEECGWMGSVGPADEGDWPQLPLGHVVDKRFIVKEFLDVSPGHAIRSYLGEEQADGEAVLITEARAETPAAKALKREYTILQEVAHPAVPHGLGLSHAEGSVLLVVERPVGTTLNEVWQQDQVSEIQRLDWLDQLCDALIELHTRDVVYLAVHPERLLVTEDRKLMLADSSRARRLPIDADDRLLGFEHYSAPEVFIDPQEVTPRADIYSVGATWYALLLGRPLSSEEFEGKFYARPPIDVMPALLPAVNRTIARAMERVPERRQKSVFYVRDALRETKSQIERESSDTVGVCSDTGMARDANEDSHLVEEFHIGGERLQVRCGLYLVSDGMGGESGGGLASRLTVQTVSERVLPDLQSYSRREIGQDLSHRIEPLLQEAISEACAAVYERAQEDPMLQRMGATIVAAVLLGRQLYVANVGDSRAYLITPEGITQLSKDHTLIAQLLERGEIDEDEARDHPARGRLTRNIGAKPEAEIHFSHRELDSGDIILLCCDGLTDVVKDQEIRDAVREAHGYQEACHDLVNLANSRGGPDNVTVIATSVDGGE